MKVLVFSERELRDALKDGAPLPSHCISIRNPDEQLPRAIKDGFVSILELKFYDTDSVDHLGPQQTIKRIPELRDVKGIIEYVNRTKAKATGYAIHCWEGISRSPAVALGVLYMLLGSESAAESQLRNNRPTARPLSRIVALFDQALGCDLSKVSDKIRTDRLVAMKREIEGDQAADEFLKKMSGEVNRTPSSRS
jgi:predicted protein tyrosine phosphatase